jgi:hypothetical protein
VAGVVVAAVLAAAATHRTAHAAKHLWWVAALVAAPVAAVVHGASPVPWAPTVATGGLVAAALVDTVEQRIPTSVAHLTTGVSLVALTAYAADRGAWGDLLVRPVLLTAPVVAGFALLWLAREAGLGDVRMAASILTAMVVGPRSLLLVVWGAFALAGPVMLVVRRVRRDRPRTVAFGPCFLAGWLLAIAVG